MCCVYTHSYRMMIYAEHLTQREAHAVTGIRTFSLAMIYLFIYLTVM